MKNLDYYYKISLNKNQRENILPMNSSKLTPTEQEYHLQCKIKAFKAGYFTPKGNQLTEEMVILIPKENSETWKFYAAWLPQSNDEKVEVPMLIRLPTFIQPCRGAVLTEMKTKSGDTIYNRPCIFVMSKPSEDALIAEHHRLAGSPRVDDYDVDVVIFGEQHDTGDHGMTDNASY